MPHNVQFDLRDAERDVVGGLRKLNIIKSGSDILQKKTWIHEFGYPICSLTHIGDRNMILRLLNAMGIHSVGSWGSWHYWNTDKVYEAVLSTADGILLEDNQ